MDREQIQKTVIGESMKKPIDIIKPNHHRNFDIYPIGEAQVQVLIESINDVGMFAGLPARKVGDFYEIACGHHRLEALKRVGITVVDLAVNDYTDEEMLKIMIKENSTQRGNENFGAVLDSVGAVLVQIVKEILITKNFSELPTRGASPIDSIFNGTGVSSELIHRKEISLSLGNIRSALTTFRNTGTYLQLLKKGGLPKEYWHLYEKPKESTIEAAAMFAKPAHAAEWMKQVDNEVFKERFPVECHEAMVADMIRDGDNTGITVPLIRGYINKKINPNVDLQPDKSKEKKTVDEFSAELVKEIKALYKKTIKFKEEKGVKDCYFENIDPIILPLIDNLNWIMDIRNSKVIDI